MEKEEQDGPARARKPARGRRPDPGLLFVAGLALASISVAWYRFGWGQVGEIFADDLGLVVAIAPKIAAGVLIATFLALLLPRELVGRWLGGESGIVGLLVATVAGIVIPGGPGVIMPLCLGLLSAGADRGAVAALISGWLLLGLNRIVVWEMSFFDADFVMLRMAVTLPAPVIVGLLVRALVAAEGRGETGG